MRTEVPRLLGAVPDGTVVDLWMAAAPGEETEAEPPVEGRQRYRGAVTAGTWGLEACHPAVPAAVLREALELGTELLEGKKLTARDPAEAAALLVHAVDIVMSEVRALQLRLYGPQEAFSKPVGDPGLPPPAVLEELRSNYPQGASLRTLAEVVHVEKGRILTFLRSSDERVDVREISETVHFGLAFRLFRWRFGAHWPATVEVPGVIAGRYMPIRTMRQAIEEWGALDVPWPEAFDWARQRPDDPR